MPARSPPAQRITTLPQANLYRLPSSPVPQDADEARKLIEAEGGTEALLIPADLSEGQEVCQKIVDQVMLALLLLRDPVTACGC